MEKRKLGNSGIEVVPWAFGGNVLGWTADEATSFQLLDAFTDAGFNLIDTADVYARWKTGSAGGDSEMMIGKWLKKSGKRDKVVIATKVGMEMAPDKKGLSRNHIFSSVEDSLKRLQTDHIDLYQSHKDDPDTPQEETLAVYAELVKQGKVKAIGASNFSAQRLTEALEISKQHGYPVYQTLQPLYNLYDREVYEKELEAVCIKHGLGVIPYYSLASGFLTGKYRDDADFAKSVRGQGVKKKYFNERGINILAALDEVADQFNATPAQVSLAWLLARPGITAPIASATSVEQLHELAKGITLKLDVEAVEKLNEASRW